MTLFRSTNKRCLIESGMVAHAMQKALRRVNFNLFLGCS